MLVGIASLLTHLMLDISIETVAKEMLDLLHKHISPPLASASPNGKVNDSVKACRSSVSRSETGTCGHTSRSVLRPTHSALQHCMCERHLSVGERLANYKGRSTSKFLLDNSSLRFTLKIPQNTSNKDLTWWAGRSPR